MLYKLTFNFLAYLCKFHHWKHTSAENKNSKHWDTLCSSHNRHCCDYNTTPLEDTYR